MSIEDIFNDAVNEINSLPKGESPLTNTEKLEMYSLYKQATNGDNTTPKPGMFDLVGKSKWNAWSKLRGMDKEDAMMTYCEKYNELKETYSF
jgi:diazepam-binding inhibitor (GABA receptor modulating acyl-CoA-binding protein)